MTMPYVYLLLIWSSGSKTDEQLRNKQIRAWRKTSQITALLTSYCEMAVKHGPDSDEAQAFKFHIGDQNLLGDDEEGQQAFLIASSVFDEALRKFSRRK